MPDGEDPDDVTPNPIDEAIGTDDDFPMRELGEARKAAP
jgi:hypothetical protein